MKGNRTLTILTLACALVFGTGTVMASSAADNSNADVQHSIQSTLDTSVDLHLPVTAMVTDDSVTLMGYANSVQERDEILTIANCYAGNRTVVDQISIGGVNGY